MRLSVRAPYAEGYQINLAATPAANPSVPPMADSPAIPYRNETDAPRLHARLITANHTANHWANPGDNERAREH